MTERVFIVRAKGVGTKIVRLEGISVLRSEPSGPERWAIVADLMVGEAVRVVEGLGALETEDLLSELVLWLTRRGGMAFDVEAWRAQWRELAEAGAQDRRRSIRRPA